MKKVIIALLGMALSLPSAQARGTDDVSVASLKMMAPRLDTVMSPDGRIMATFGLNGDGEAQYTVDYEGRSVIVPSRLGVRLQGREDMRQGLRLDSVTRRSADVTWHPVWGERRDIRDHYNAYTAHLSQPSTGALLDIAMRVYDDGVALRYEWPLQPGRKRNNYLVIKGEDTEFALPGDMAAWWIPGDYDTQEYEYTRSLLSEMRGFQEGAVTDNMSTTRAPLPSAQTSLQLKSPDGLYINLHEAALVNYPAMHLMLNDTTMTFTSLLTPDAQGLAARVVAPFNTPWRTIMVSPTATGILASPLILNLNEPCAIDDVSWIHPVKYMGVWWEMISGKGDWHYTDDLPSVQAGVTDYSQCRPNPRHSANNANVRRYIDYAADNGFDAVLVEGWNTGWEYYGSAMKEDIFDFVTPYPDFDLKALNDYAHSRGIKLIMHHETNSSVMNYERHLDEAYRLMKDHGYDAVKSGYVGDITPRGLHHYGQEINNHYLAAIKRAADYHIMVNAHEAVRPTGLCRTYPNMIGNESAMGTEFQAFGGIQPGHTAMLPFTRLQGGPMDYTPGIFEMECASGSHVNSTICGQLGLYVTMPGPLQMAADMPENYDRWPEAFQFIKDVAIDWDDSYYLEAEPMEYITVARKARDKDEWYIGGVAGQEPRTARISLSFLPKGTFTATIYQDAPEADYRTNPQAYKVTKRKVTARDILDIDEAAGGGLAVRIAR